jgi:hypothetical protein
LGVFPYRILNYLSYNINYHNSLFKDWVEDVLKFVLVEGANQFLKSVRVVYEFGLPFVEEIDYSFKLFFVLFWIIEFLLSATFFCTFFLLLYYFLFCFFFIIKSSVPPTSAYGLFISSRFACTPLIINQRITSQM